MIDVDALAAQLFDAEETATPIPFPSETHPEIDWDTARRIARANDALRRHNDDRLVGYKLGWTSAAMRDALGIDRPNWGTLWASHVVDASVSLDRFIHPKIEPELVYRARADLHGDIDAESVRAAGGEWALGIEVVDPRFPSFSFAALDNTADNSSRAAVRIGSFASLAGIDLAELRIRFTASGDDTARDGTGAQTMGAPEEAIAWLVRQLQAEGEGLRAGQIVFAGGLTAPFDAEAGCDYEVTSPLLGAATLRFD